jgi:hypothetical protein
LPPALPLLKSPVKAQRLHQPYLQPQLICLSLARALTPNLTQYLGPGQQNALEEATKWLPILLPNLLRLLKTRLQRLQRRRKPRRLTLKLAVSGQLVSPAHDARLVWLHSLAARQHPWPT